MVIFNRTLFFFCLLLQFLGAHTITDTTLYEDAKYPQFEGNYVAHLSDGSEWKIHPKDCEVYAQWTRDEEIDNGLRTSYYFFKREHRFLLKNGSRNEKVRAMILKHPDSSLPTITKTQDDSITYYIPVGEMIVPYKEHRTVIHLNDGSAYLAHTPITKKWCQEGRQLFVNRLNSKWSYVIFGTGPKASYFWIKNWD